ncbi:glycosyltransferase family 4 protein [Sphingomonas glacialis]|nr:glycosyltransferase family 1 protein [Sphingomonas glacialis]
MNLVRLLPETQGAGGAGRFVTALLTHLPQHVDLRVAIAAHSEHLSAGFPAINWITVPEDTNVYLTDHLRWCQCYIDPLNGLRPTSIDPAVAVISILLDLQHMRMPWLFSASEMSSRLAEYTYAVARADRLVVISEYERDNFREFYGADRVSVVHLAGFMAEDTATRRQIDPAPAEPQARYLLYPAVPWLHKNHEVLIQAIGHLKRRGIEVPVILTNVGDRGGIRKALTDSVKANGVDGLVVPKAYLPEPELYDLFVQSTGLVFPSLYEGFGIPLVDAMALGVPVLANRTSAVPEICAGAVSYFANAANPIAVANDILVFWEDADTREANKRAGIRQAEKFSSEKMAANLLDAIDQAIAAKGAHCARGAAVRPSSPAPFRPISILILYVDLGPADIAWLSARGGLADFHGSVFGADTDISVAAAQGMCADHDMDALFSGVPKFLYCADTSKSAVDHAVADFSARYDRSSLQLVVRFDHRRFGRYSPDRIALAAMALDLHQEADYAVLDPDVADCVLDSTPTEVSGVLQYEQLRRSGASVFDMIVKRSSVADLRNGSTAYLSHLCTKLRCLRVPSA